MKKKIFRSFFRVMPAVLLGISTISCSEMFDVKPENTLDKEQFYQNRFDADAAVVGVYGKFMGLAEQYIVLNELRADLLTLTVNSTGDRDLADLNYHDVQESANNKYADPKPFYEVILACNDVLENLKRMVAENKLTQKEFEQRYSDVGALRSWVYLQLGIHFNEIPYITSSLENVGDLQNIMEKENVTWLRLDNGSLLDSLISFTSTLPYMDEYTPESSLIEDLSSEKFYINKKFLLGDLYLWNGDYTLAASQYKVLMDRGNDLSTFKIGWVNRFEHETGFENLESRAAQDEWIWTVPFNVNYTPENPFIKLFSQAGAGSYLLKPSEEAIQHWLSARTANNTPDLRAEYAVDVQNDNQLVVGKYLYKYNPLSSAYEKPGDWFLARAALLHLRFAEAANRDGEHKVAYALLNSGIKVTYDPNPAGGDNRDVRDIQNTFLPFPYNFNGQFTRSFGTIRGPYMMNLGIRGRAGLPPIAVSNDSLRSIENALIHESGLELAFEGHRWPDLLRVAMRRNQPEFLALTVAEKFQQANDPRADEVYNRLMDPANWFLPFRWE